MGVTAFLAYAEGTDPDVAFATAQASVVREHDGRGFSAMLGPDATYTVLDAAPTDMATATRRAADILLDHKDDDPTGVCAFAVRGGTRTLSAAVPPRPQGWDSLADAVRAAVPLADGETIQGVPTGDYTTVENTQRVTGGTVTVTIAGGTAHTGWLFFGWSSNP